jgi:hypothetical protein
VVILDDDDEQEEEEALKESHKSVASSLYII